MTDHTPTPWRRENRANFRVVCGDGDTVATVACDSGIRDQWENNAVFIVTAANNHEPLVRALRLARARIEYLGIACPGSTHFEANENTFLPAIDEVLAGVVGGPSASTLPPANRDAPEPIENKKGGSQS
jgi:hypothetical protein